MPLWTMGSEEWQEGHVAELGEHDNNDVRALFATETK